MLIDRNAIAIFLYNAEKAVDAMQTVKKKLYVKKKDSDPAMFRSK